MFKGLFFAFLVIAAGLFSAVMFGEKLNAEEVKKEAVVATISKQELLKIGENEAVLGDVDAPVTIIEYASLSCSHCAKFHTDVLPKLKEKYIDNGKVNLVLRNFPLNAPAFRGAMLLGCVDKDQYYTFAKVLFEMQGKWAFTSNFLGDLKKIAQVGGVSSEKFDECVNDEAVKKKALDDRKTADDVLDIQATPTFFINGQTIRGGSTIDKFSEIIDPILAATK